MHIDWTGVQYWLALYKLNNILEISENIARIKEIATSFDSIYDSRINTDAVKKAMADLKARGFYKS